MVKISIIMPVYNTGIYLEECLESIFNQTFTEFELICVDDCSTDELTKKILERYQKQHSNMSAISLEQNTGAGEARNIGFSKAQGEFVIFLDADDVFSKELLSRMYQCIVEENTDVCICGYSSFCVGDNGNKIYKEDIIPTQKKVQGKEDESWFLNQIYAPWNKLCKRSFLIEQNIYFQNIASSNDVFFSCMALRKAKKISVIEEVLVKYRTNLSGQISAKHNPCNIFRAIELLEEKLEENENITKQLFWMKLRLGWYEFNINKNEEYQKKAYDELADICKKNQDLSIKSLKGKFLRRNILKYSFESKWFCQEMNFFDQLKCSTGEINKIIGNAGELYLWGIGNRGNAFQRLCKEEKILLSGVTDKENKEIGRKTLYGYEIMHTETVLKSSGKIIASNSKIYDTLVKEIREKNRIINLEEYCPWAENGELKK